MTGKDDYIYSDLTRKIIGAAMKVHAFLGSGFPEVIYQRSLAIEFVDQGILFEREKITDVYYKKRKVGSRIVDFYVDRKVLVELKAVAVLDRNHYAQILNYLKAYDMKIGLLINFGATSLEFKRFIR